MLFEVWSIVDGHVELEGSFTEYEEAMICVEELKSEDELAGLEEVRDYYVEVHLASDYYI